MAIIYELSKFLHWFPPKYIAQNHAGFSPFAIYFGEMKNIIFFSFGDIFYMAEKMKIK